MRTVLSPYGREKGTTLMEPVFTGAQQASSSAKGKSRDKSTPWSEWMYDEENRSFYQWRYNRDGTEERYYGTSWEPEHIGSDQERQSSEQLMGYGYTTPYPEARQTIQQVDQPLHEATSSFVSGGYTTEYPQETQITQQVAQPLHEAYVRVNNPRKYFTKGRVFMAPWIEQAGPSATDIKHISPAPLGQNAYTEIRRFVVMRSRPGYCLAVAIHTYRGRGDRKRESRPGDYAQVFDVVRDEDWDRSRLSEKQIPIVLEHAGIAINYPSARIHFGKLYTIEDYLMVRTIGYVHKEAMPLLENCFRESLGIDTLLDNATSTGSTSSAVSTTTATARDLTINEQGSQLESISSIGRGFNPKTIHATEKTSKLEKLSSRYQVISEKNQKAFWKHGRVFMMLWTEPSANAGFGTRDGSHISTTWLNQAAYSEIRRFVVIRRAHDNCICCPISSYSGQATLKAGLLNPQDHAIIYTADQPPPKHTYIDPSGNVVTENLTKPPIRVRRVCPGPEGDLGTLSRINYSKMYTVPYYVRVLDIGMVYKDSLPDLEASSIVKNVQMSEAQLREETKENKNWFGKKIS